MKIPQSEGGEKFPICDAGTFIGRGVHLFDLGTKLNGYFDEAGRPRKSNQIKIGFEILGDAPRRTDGAPFIVYIDFTKSWGRSDKRSNLYKFVRGYVGKDLTEEQLDRFEPASFFLDKFFTINVIHAQGKKDPTKTYANIAGISPVMKGMPLPEGVNEVVLFDMDAPNYLDAVSKVPEWIMKDIEGSDEWKRLNALPREERHPNLTPPPLSDDVPF